MLKAILIDCIPLDMSKDEAAYRLSEAESLIKTYGGVVLLKSLQKKISPIYKTFIGSGKMAELMEEGKRLGANILIVNNELKPLQTYNLSEQFKKVNLAVWDRVDLILKIFQKHAETKEAKLEIELASLKHMGPRIYGMGMVLSRQAAGIGTKGIGETNTEIMKRHIALHVKKIERELEKSQRSRELHRDSRRRKNFKTVGIVGYTNAGKSSLLNALTRKGAYSADELFATLDTRVAKLHYENFQHAVLLTDTIGFIQDLPTSLIKSFHSTLEETVYADLLIHVIDLSDPRLHRKITVVNEVLASLEAHQKPVIYVFNKADLTPPTIDSTSILKEFARFSPIIVSSITGQGLTELKKIIEQKLYPESV